MNGRLPQQQAMADAIRAQQVAQTGAPSQYMGMGGTDPGQPGLGGGGSGLAPGIQQSSAVGGLGVGTPNTMGVPGAVNPTNLTNPGNPNMPV